MSIPLQPLSLLSKHLASEGGVSGKLRLPRNPAAEMMAAVRAEKRRHTEAMSARQQDLRVADYLEANLQVIEIAKKYTARFLAGERHHRHHWVLQQWKELLETKTPAELVAILLDTSDASEELRSSPPFCDIKHECFLNFELSVSKIYLSPNM